VAKNRFRASHGSSSPDTQAGLVIQAATAFSGPLPPPHLLEKYNEIIPNGAERIMAMAEKQSAHREHLEAHVINGNVASQTRGSYFSFIISLVAIVGGFILIEQGKSATGLAAIITSLASLVGVFVYSKHEQKKERIEKTLAMQALKNPR
jgi:uncharacterized membrane protein